MFWNMRKKNSFIVNTAVHIFLRMITEPHIRYHVVCMFFFNEYSIKCIISGFMPKKKKKKYCVFDVWLLLSNSY